MTYLTHLGKNWASTQNLKLEGWSTKYFVLFLSLNLSQLEFQLIGLPQTAISVHIATKELGKKQSTNVIWESTMDKLPLTCSTVTPFTCEKNNQWSRAHLAGCIDCEDALRHWVQSSRKCDAWWQRDGVDTGARLQVTQEQPWVFCDHVQKTNTSWYLHAGRYENNRVNQFWWRNYHHIKPILNIQLKRPSFLCTTIELTFWQSVTWRKTLNMCKNLQSSRDRLSESLVSPTRIIEQ